MPDALAGFLAGKDLTERDSFLARSRRSASELAQSSLAGPLPEVIGQRQLLLYESGSAHYIELTFQSPERDPSPVLVQLTKNAQGRFLVHTDAFIDLYDDQLGEFGKAATGDTRTFHVVADAYKNCFDESIPDPSTKSFLKLRAHPRVSPRLVAYFVRDSPLAADFSDSDGLPWGQSGICTVTVRWNTDHTEMPYVELVRVESLNWHH